MALDLSGMKKLLRSVETLADDFDTWIKGFLTTESLRALRLVKPLTPVDTGQLRANWTVTEVLRTGEALQVSLVNNTEYASFMEYGFTYHTRRGDGWWEGIHMAELSLAQIRAAMPARYQREFNRWLKTLGWS